MKAAVYYSTGPPDVFRYEDVPDPHAEPGAALMLVAFRQIELRKITGHQHVAPGRIRPKSGFVLSASLISQGMESGSV